MLFIFLLIFVSSCTTGNIKDNEEVKENTVFPIYSNSELDIPKIGENENFKITNIKVKYASIPWEFKIKTRPLNSSVYAIIEELWKEKINWLNGKIISKLEINEEYYKSKEVEIKPDGIYDIKFDIYSENGYKWKINIYPFDLDKYHWLWYWKEVPDVIVFDNTKIPNLNIDNTLLFERKTFVVEKEDNARKNVEIFYPYYEVDVDFKKWDNFFSFEMIKESQSSILWEKWFIFETDFDWKN